MHIALYTASMSRFKVICAVVVLTAILQLTEAGVKCRGDGDECDRRKTGNRAYTRDDSGFDESSRHGSNSGSDDASDRNIERDPGFDQSDDEGEVFSSDYLPDRSSSVDRHQLLQNFMEAKNRHLSRMRNFRGHGRTDDDDGPHNPGPGGPVDVDIQKLHKAMQQRSFSGNKIDVGTTPESLSTDAVTEDLPEYSTSSPSPIIDEILKDKTYNVYNQFLEMDKTNPKTTPTTSSGTDTGSAKVKPFVSLLTPSTPVEALYLYSAIPEFSTKYPSFQSAQPDDLFLGLYGGLDSSAYSGLLGNYYTSGTGTAYDPGLPAFGASYPVYGAGTGGGGFTLHG